MLRKFKIAIDGKEYLVEMEEIGAPVVQAPAAPVAAPAPVVEETPVVAPAASTPAGADAILAPMPGTVLKVLVAPGEAVKKNQPLLILEAMKMENEIVADKDGVVAGIHTNQGDMVNPGDALVTIN
ncbi:MAG: acetyl-CoA carboxylase biotin carboxyl carrier protein subunit [Streptococcaceae bacterium]|jgi:biotin carboxyl carrier protein|nr:acetyl-CoA carboxylase biotin carboxyl carrier protein subunit [Streptococcaceae bacterium]